MSASTTATSVDGAGTVSASALDDALSKTRDFLASVREIHSAAAEAERKASKESKAARDAREKAQAIESEHARLHRLHNEEHEEHVMTRAKAEELQKNAQRMAEDLKAAQDELAAIRLENEALVVEMEAKRKAFMCNLNLAGRHSELKAKYEELRAQFDKLHEEAIPMKAQLETVDSRLQELDDLKALLAAESMRKEHSKAKAIKALEKSLLKNDQALMAAALSAYYGVVHADKIAKAKKDANMQKGLRAIAGQTSALLQFIYQQWREVLKEAKRQALIDAANGDQAAQAGNVKDAAARAREKALQQLEKQFGAQGQRLMRRSIEVWREARRTRLNKEKTRNNALRGIASSELAVRVTVYGAWAKVTKEARDKRQSKDQSMAKALRMVAGHETTLKGTIVNMWQRLARNTKEQKALKEQGNQKAARMMANSGAALQAGAFSAWSQEVKKGKDKAHRLKVVERSLVSSDQGLMALVYQNWTKQVEKNKSMRKKKDLNMKRALKGIDGTMQALQDKVFTLWQREVEKAKQLKLIEEGKKAVEFQKQLEASTAELAKLRTEIEEHKANHRNVSSRLEVAEAKVIETSKALDDRDRRLRDALNELDDSRRKAACISDELAKVGVFLQTTPRKKPNRPMSGLKNQPQDEGRLPQIHGGDAGSRPRSGTSRPPVVPAPPSRTAWGDDHGPGYAGLS